MFRGKEMKDSKFKKEFSNYLQNQKNKKKLKEIKEITRIKKEKLKVKKQNNMHTFIAKAHKSKIYCGRTFNGAVPLQVSKKLKMKKK